MNSEGKWPVHVADLNGRVVLITGASSGIGAAVSLGFARCGAKLMIHYNENERDAVNLLEDVKRLGGEGACVGGDLADRSQPQKIIEATLSRFGRLDVLVNNAGALFGRKSLVEITDDHYDRLMNVNAWSVMAMMRLAKPIMNRQGGGAIINVTSIAARNGGGPGSELYAAAKGFVSSLTRGLAKSMWRENRIRVNAVAPGTIETRFHQRNTTAEQLEAMRQTIPMGSIGSPDDCVGAFLFLASPSMSGYMIGQVLEVNGGQLMP
jgi:3-oxoacyl-[acyl-carrier protein] reductase